MMPLIQIDFLLYNMEAGKNRGGGVSRRRRERERSRLRE
jgi:hypothetical protein